MRLRQTIPSILLAWAATAALMLTGCANQDRLVVYADPWLEDYAVQLCAAYEKEHPETEIALKVISTEVIAQHIHFGQPIDVALCFASDRIQDREVWAELADQSTLAGSEIVEAKVSDPRFLPKFKALGTTEHVMIEASDRPSRLLADAIDPVKGIRGRQVVIANFQRQAEDYLLRGWVPSGYVPVHFVRQNPLLLQVIATGEHEGNAFSAMIFKDPPHPAQASSFFAFTNSEKSRQILGELKILP